MSTLPERLQALGPTIERICSISGTPGVSIGVAQKGQPIFKRSFGHRDIETQEAPDEQTIFHIASLTKNFAAWAVASLVSDGKLKWHTPIVDILPTFKLKDDNLTANVNIVDFLAHRVGIAGGNAFWSQGGNRNHIAKGEALRIIGNLPQAMDFRDSFLYHNMGYSVVAEVIEHLSGQSFGTYLTKRILEPLGMTRTVITPSEPQHDNRARAYIPMTDGTFFEISPPESQDGTVQAAAGGIRSCVEDLLKYYSAILQARQADLAGQSNEATQILKDAGRVTAGHNFIEKVSQLEKTYGLGLLRAQLPNTLGDIGPNVGLIKSMPVIGDSSTSQLVIYAQGSYPGFLSSVFLLEQSETVIVVLSNSLAFNDAADWIGQLLVEEVLDVKKRTDFEQLAQESKTTYLKSFADAEERLRSKKEDHPAIRLPDEYVGDYYNTLDNFFLRILMSDGGLAMNFLGKDWDIYKLEPYAKDTFSWWVSRDEQARRGRWPRAAENYFKLQFVPDENGVIESVLWLHDPAIPAGEKFYKRQPH